MKTRVAPIIHRAWAHGLLALGLVLSGLAQQAPPLAAAGTVARPAAAGVCQNLAGDSDFEAAVGSPWHWTALPGKDLVVGPGGFFGPDTVSTGPIRQCIPGGACEWLVAGRNDPAGPYPDGGINWLWFGGAFTSTLPISNVVQIVTQTVSVPVTATAHLEFDFWISRADPGSDADDRVEVRFGDTAVFTASAAATATYASGYTPVTVDLSAFGSGLSTTLTLSGTTHARQSPEGQDLLPPVVNFNIDNVRVCADALPATPTTPPPSPTTPSATPTTPVPGATTPPATATTPPPPSSTPPAPSSTPPAPQPPLYLPMVSRGG